MQDSNGSPISRVLKRGLHLALPVLLSGVLFYFTILSNQTAASGATAILPDSSPAAQSFETSRDVYYRTKGTPTGPPAPQLSYPNDYGTLGHFQSRTLVWILAQQHNYFGSFVLGVLFLITIFEVRGIISQGKETSRRYDGLALAWLGVVLLALSVTAITGGVFLFGLLSFYPGLTKYLATVLRSLLLVYGLLIPFFSATVVLYYYTWPRMEKGNSKWIHASIGVLANFFGILMMMIANSWATFMMSPSGVDEEGRFLGNSWRVLHNALWNPFNVHRFFGGILLGASIISAYAAYSALTATTQDRKTYFDWMGRVAIVAIFLSLFTLPFGGYWLWREHYAYKQVFGIILAGGLLAWVNLVLVTLVGLLFLGINYYFWQGIDASPAGGRYRKQAKIVLLILIVSLLVYMTPHTIVMTPAELKAMGGAQHPVTGNYGVEGAKSTAVNIMIITTFWSLLVWWRCRYRISRSTLLVGTTALAVVFLAGMANIIGLGIYGYSIPANVRIGLSVPMVMTAVSICVFGSLITLLTIRRADRIDPLAWGHLPVRGNYALLFIAVAVTWIMGVSGYIRSSVRLHWHVTEILRDNSPWAFTNPLGYAGYIVTLNVLIFWSGLLFLFWLVELSDSLSMMEIDQGHFGAIQHHEERNAFEI